MKRTRKQDSVFYIDMRWPELKKMAADGAIVLLPIGQTEEHGPHLPVGTDVFIAQETARALGETAAREMPVLVMPAVWCGFSGHDLFRWPGVISMTPELVISVIENICVSLSKSGFKKIVTMNSHGHHDAIARVAARKVADACDACMVVTDIWKMANDVVTRLRKSGPGGCCHACEYETAILLHLQKRVNMKLAVDEPVKSHSSFVSGDNFGSGSRVFWSTWRYQKSRSGTYGAPTFATAEQGRKMFEGTIDAYMKLLREVRRAPTAVK